MVGLVQLDAVVGGVGPEAHRDGARLVQLDLPQKDVRGAEQRVDRLAGRVGDRLRQRVEGAEEERWGVDG